MTSPVDRAWGARRSELPEPWAAALADAHAGAGDGAFTRRPDLPFDTAMLGLAAVCCGFPCVFYFTLVFEGLADPRSWFEALFLVVAAVPTAAFLHGAWHWVRNGRRYGVAVTRFGLIGQLGDDRTVCPWASLEGVEDRASARVPLRVRFGTGAVSVDRDAPSRAGTVAFGAITSGDWKWFTVRGLDSPLGVCGRTKDRDATAAFFRAFALHRAAAEASPPPLNPRPPFPSFGRRQRRVMIAAFVASWVAYGAVVRPAASRAVHENVVASKFCRGCPRTYENMSNSPPDLAELVASEGGSALGELARRRYDQCVRNEMINRRGHETPGQRQVRLQNYDRVMGTHFTDAPEAFPMPQEPCVSPWRE